jgi:glycosyltransferase involved in cell wall biosynthesis
MTTGFTFLLLIHITVVISRLSEQNKELIQELGLGRLAPQARGTDLLVIVPAYNEAKAIGRVIEDLRSLDLPLDILVVNDGSADATSAQAKATGQALVVDLPKNLGIGGAVQTGFKFAARNGYQVAIQFDGDGQHLATEIPKLLARLGEGGVNMVIGSRFLEKHAGYRSTFVRRLGIRVFEGVNSILIRQRITDNTSGFRAYDHRAIDFLARHYPVDYPEPEAVILLGRNGFRISEVPALMRERQEGGSSIAGVKGIYYMVKVVLAILMTALRKPLVAVRGEE